MQLSTHLLASVVLSILLFPLVGWVSLWVLVGGFLIDTDHVLYYGWKFKKWSVKEAYIYCKYRQSEKKYDKDNLHIFHTVEFWIIMLIGIILSAGRSAFVFNMFFLAFIGMLVHLIMDFLNLTFRDRLDARYLFCIQWLKQRRQK